MASWSPREAAEFRSSSTVQALRLLETDKLARRGLRRTISMARASGYGEVVVVGLKFSTAAASPRPLWDGARAKQQGDEAVDLLRQRRQETPKAPPQPLLRLPEGMRAELHRSPGWFTTGKWKAASQHRFGIKKQVQKLQTVLRVAAGIARWLRRARGRASARGAAHGGAAEPTPPPSKLRRLEIVDVDEMEQEPTFQEVEQAPHLGARSGASFTPVGLSHCTRGTRAVPYDPPDVCGGAV